MDYSSCQQKLIGFLDLFNLCKSKVEIIESKLPVAGVGVAGGYSILGEHFRLPKTMEFP
jgi:hypothetical protein